MYAIARAVERESGGPRIIILFLLSAESYSGTRSSSLIPSFSFLLLPGRCVANKDSAYVHQLLLRKADTSSTLRLASYFSCSTPPIRVPILLKQNNNRAKHGAGAAYFTWTTAAKEEVRERRHIQLLAHPGPSPIGVCLSTFKVASPICVVSVLFLCHVDSIERFF